MQKTVPKPLQQLATLIGATDIRRTHQGQGPNLYLVVDSPWLGCKASVRYRKSDRQPERQGFIVYWPFPEPNGPWIEHQERRSRLSLNEALAVLGFRPAAELTAGQAAATAAPEPPRPGPSAA